MKILNINLDVDPACVGGNLSRAINKYTDHECHHLSYSKAITYSISKWQDVVYDLILEDELAALIESADILHFNQYDWMFKIYGKENNFKTIKNYIKPHHKIIFHGHGGSWLLNPTSQIERCKEVGAHIVVCSPLDPCVIQYDLCKWIPNVLDVEEKLHPNWNRDFKNEIIIGQAANHSAGVYKGAELVKYMVDHLGTNEHKYPVKYEMITGAILEESLKMRREHHMTVDNWVQGFSGMAGFEGLALGHIVFARFDKVVADAWCGFAEEMIPIVDIKGFDTCAREIRQYCDDRDLLVEDSRKSRVWIEKYYNEKTIVDKWIKYYEGL